MHLRVAQDASIPHRGWWWAVETALGAAWLLAAGAKAVHPLPASTAGWAAALAVAAESTVGLHLWVVRGRRAAWMSVGWTAALLLYAVVAEGWMQVPECGCLGAAHLARAWRLGLLGVALTGAGALALAHERTPPGSRDVR